MIPPRTSPERDLTLETDGYLAEVAARLRGRSLIPWQRHAADLIGERIPDPDVRTGWRYRYPVAICLVPRQCGKTSLAFDIALGRALGLEDYRAAFTAQTGTVVSDRFTEQRSLIGSSLASAYFQTRASAGTERISVIKDGRLGSYVKAFPPKDGALRGSALDLVIVDEAQEHPSRLGDALDATILPTFSTRPRRQLLLLGTAGTDLSGYLRRYRTKAQAGADGYLLLEYGALDDEDYLDRDVWRARHPGIGPLADMAGLEAALSTLGPASFAREYLNIWTSGASWVVEPELWQACQDETLTLPDSLILGIDASPDRTHAAIAGSWRDAAGNICLAVLWTGTADGLRAAADRLSTELSARVTFDHYSAGPSAAGSQGWLSLPVRGLAGASALILESARNGTLRVRPDSELDAAMAGAKTREVGTGLGFTFTRKGTDANLTPLMAATIALGGLLEQREPMLLA